MSSPGQGLVLLTGRCVAAICAHAVLHRKVIAMRRLQIVLIGLVIMLGAAPMYASKVIVTTGERSPVRTGPDDNDARITVLPPGARLWATDRDGDWYRVRLHDSLDGWISVSSCNELDGDEQYRDAMLQNISFSDRDGSTRAQFRLSSPVPFRVRQIINPSQLQIDLFCCSAAQEAIRISPETRFIRPLLPQQLGNGWVEMTLDLPDCHQSGYRAFYTAAGDLVIDVKKPFASASLEGKLIAIDPGHGGSSPGAVGPTKVTEKSVNLAISLLLKQELEQAGARVLMTREDDMAVATASSKSGELDARVEKTKEAFADFFLSVHNNAPWSVSEAATAMGTETYYWTPMSYLPATMIQRALVAAVGTRDRFVSWRPFYVLRETDCPRVLVECAFISNPEEEAKLADPDFQHQISIGILQGMRDYFAAAVLPPSMPSYVSPLNILPASPEPQR